MENKLNTKNYSKSPNTVVKPSSNCGINGHWQNRVSGGNRGRLQDDVYIWVCVRGFLEWAGERKTIALARLGSQDSQYQNRHLLAMVPSQDPGISVKRTSPINRTCNILSSELNFLYWWSLPGPRGNCRQTPFSWPSFKFTSHWHHPAHLFIIIQENSTILYLSFWTYHLILNLIHNITIWDLAVCSNVPQRSHFTTSAKPENEYMVM